MAETAEARCRTTAGSPLPHTSCLKPSIDKAYERFSRETAAKVLKIPEVLSFVDFMVQGDRSVVCMVCPSFSFYFTGFTPFTMPTMFSRKRLMGKGLLLLLTSKALDRLDGRAVFGAGTGAPAARLWLNRRLFPVGSGRYLLLRKTLVRSGRLSGRTAAF